MLFRSFVAGAAFLATAFLAGALAFVFNLALALALCLVDFTAHLLSARPREILVLSLTAANFFQLHLCDKHRMPSHTVSLARGLYSAYALL